MRRKWILSPDVIYTILNIIKCHFPLTDLEKKLQDLNQTRQDKADQLKRLEDQVTAIKNEIMEQENKYATCKS